MCGNSGVCSFLFYVVFLMTIIVVHLKTLRGVFGNWFWCVSARIGFWLVLLFCRCFSNDGLAWGLARSGLQWEIVDRIHIERNCVSLVSGQNKVEGGGRRRQLQKK